MLPTKWAEATIEEMTTYVSRGRSPKYVEYSNFPVVNQKAIRWAGVDPQYLKFIDPATEAQRSEERLLRNGDILWNSTGTGTIGRAALFDLAGEYARIVADSHVTIVRCNESTDPKYLFSYIRSPAIQSIIDDMQSGSTNQVELNKGTVLATRVPLPPLPEQRRIVAKLDALTARLTRARAELDQVLKMVKRLRQKAAVAAFTGSLTEAWRTSHPSATVANDGALEEAYKKITGSPRRKPVSLIDWLPSVGIPSSWRWVSVDQVVARVQYGSSEKTSGDDQGVPVLRMGNIQDGELDWSDLKYLPQEHPEFPELLLVNGDILFNRTNSFELVGKSAVCKDLKQRTSFASYLIRIRTSGILPELLAAYINSSIGRAWAESVASQQVGQANVNGSKLKAMGIPLPSIEEQVEMLRSIRNTFARADRLEAEAARSKKLLDRMESAILTKAFKGELVPQDPNDEPVTQLLDRIRAQRAIKSTVNRRPNGQSVKPRSFKSQPSEPI